MLGDAVPNPPKKVTIKIARAENIELSMKEGKKKLNSKFKVTIRGGKDKQSTPIAEDQFGKPTWNITCSVKLHRQQSDPLCLLIEDSEGRQKGQVVIPIVKIKPRPYTYSDKQDPANSTNLLCSELEPTQKQSNPQGYLLYWIWIDEYYTEEEMNNGGTGKRSFNKSMHNLFGSKSRLSGSKSTLSESTADSINRLGSISELNKPVKHKSGNMLKLKLPGGLGKKKNKHSASMGGAPHPPMSSGLGQKFKMGVGEESDSDVDSRSSYGYNNLVIGNPFDNAAAPERPTLTSAGVHHGQKPSFTDTMSLESGSIFVRTPASSINYPQPSQLAQMPPPIQIDSAASDPFKRHSPTASINASNKGHSTLDSSFSDSRGETKHTNTTTSSSTKSDTNPVPVAADPFKATSPSSSAHNEYSLTQHYHQAESAQISNAMNFILPQSEEDNPFLVPQTTRPFTEFPSNHTTEIHTKPVSPLIFSSTSITTNNNKQNRGSSLTAYNREEQNQPDHYLNVYEQSRHTIGPGSTGLDDDWLNGAYSKKRPKSPSGFSGNIVGNGALPNGVIENSLTNNECEALQNECTELKRENKDLKSKLDSSESELNDVKNKLLRLRIKLLEAGQVEFLEI